MKQLRLIIISLVLVLGISLKAFSQNHIENLEVRNNENRIQINLSTKDPLNHEVLRFNSRDYTVVRIAPLVLNPENKEVLLNSFFGLDIDFQVLELVENTVMMAFKNVHTNRLSLQKSKKGNNLQINILKNKKPDNSFKKSNEQTAQEKFQKAVQFFGDQKYPDAISEVRAAIRLKPAFWDAYFLGGEIRFEMKDWGKARYNFQKVLDLEDDNIRAKEYLTRIELATIENSETDGSINGITNLVNDDENSSQQDSSQISTESEIPPVDTNEEIVESNIDSSLMEGLAYKPIAAQLISSKAKNYFQLVFFLLILSSFLGWIIYLWKNRKTLKMKKGEQVIEDFSSTLNKIQKNMKTEIKTKKLTKQIPKQKFVEPRERFTNQRKKTNSRFSSIDENQERNFNHLPFEGDRNEKVHQYASIGYSVEEIARMLSMGKSEVELILNFGGRRSPTTKPAMSFDFEESM